MIVLFLLLSIYVPLLDKGLPHILKYTFRAPPRACHHRACLSHLTKVRLFGNNGHLKKKAPTLSYSYETTARRWRILNSHFFKICRQNKLKQLWQLQAGMSCESLMLWCKLLNGIKLELTSFALKSVSPFKVDEHWPSNSKAQAAALWSLSMYSTFCSAGVVAIFAAIAAVAAAGSGPFCLPNFQLLTVKTLSKLK